MTQRLDMHTFLDPRAIGVVENPISLSFINIIPGMHLGFFEYLKILEAYMGYWTLIGWKQDG